MLAVAIVQRAVNAARVDGQRDAVAAVVADLLSPAVTKRLYDAADWGRIAARAFVFYYVVVFVELEAAVAKVTPSSSSSTNRRQHSRRCAGSVRTASARAALGARALRCDSSHAICFCNRKNAH